MGIRGCFAAGIFLLAVAGSYAAWPRKDVASIPQIWASSGATPAETDSVVACRMRDGRVLVFATQKHGDRIDAFDAESGRFVMCAGKSGDGAGEFKRPNGIVVVESESLGDRPASGPLLLIVERDNGRVQVLSAEDLSPLGTFGKGDLTRPYGAAVSYTKEGIFVYVTDTKVDPDETIKVYRLTLDDGHITGKLLRRFGDRNGKGQIKTAESIVVDDEADRVLICDEHKTRRNVKIYTREGRFTGTTFADGFIKREPEGIVVSSKYDVVIVTDQQESLTVWHVFDRKTLTHIGAVTGSPTIANTDGICIYESAIGPYSNGTLFAVHDDADVRSYPLDALLAAAADNGAKH